MPGKEDYLKTIEHFHYQFLKSYTESSKISFPDDYNDVTDIIISGMGGSSFGGRVVMSAFSKKDLLIPLNLAMDYELPSYADEKTLVIITSYSGNTEETLKVLEESVARGCKTLVITSGGKLGNVVHKDIVPGYVFDSQYNFAGTPRSGIGYVVGSTLGILSSLGYIRFTQKDAKETYEYLNEFYENMRNSKMPLSVAQKMNHKMPIFIASEHLTNAAHIWRNFLNETSKSMGFVQEVPYMNHHFLDGLRYPDGAKDEFMFVLLKSPLYGERNKKRMDVTKEVIKLNHLQEITVTLSGKSVFKEIWEVLTIGCLVSYYLSEIHSVDPISIPMVDFLKEELAKNI
jgi:glucose/mannose-6-phosphate isomerase